MDTYGMRVTIEQSMNVIQNTDNMCTHSNFRNTRFLFLTKKPHLQAVNVRRVLKDRAELIKHHDAGEETENERLDNVENREDGGQGIEIALRADG